MIYTYQVLFGLSHQRKGDTLGMCRNGRQGKCIVFWQVDTR